MNKKQLKPQLDGILSKLRLWQDKDGLGLISDFIASGGNINDLSVADKLIYSVEMGLMDLLMQIRSEQDEMRLEADGNDPWYEVMGFGGQFNSSNDAMKMIRGLSEDQRHNKMFMIYKCYGGQYTAMYKSVQIGIPGED